jgi:hypothetical protein
LVSFWDGLSQACHFGAPGIGVPLSGTDVGQFVHARTFVIQIIGALEAHPTAMCVVLGHVCMGVCIVTERAHAGSDAATDVDTFDVWAHVCGYWLNASMFAMNCAACAEVYDTGLRIDSHKISYACGGS